MLYGINFIFEMVFDDHSIVARIATITVDLIIVSSLIWYYH